jgi:Fe-S cluster biogenesis protein NfuA
VTENLERLKRIFKATEFDTFVAGRPQSVLFKYRTYKSKRKEESCKKVQAALNKIRPMLQADGVDVELVAVNDGTVTVRLNGACSGCPMSQMTLKNGIERMLKEQVPEVKTVLSAS